MRALDYPADLGGAATRGVSVSRKLVVLVAALAVVASACASEPAATPTPTARTSTVTPTSDGETASPTPTPSSTGDPYAVPDEIDTAYVQTVIDALDPVWGDMMDAFAQAESLDDPGGVERAAALFTPSWASQYLQLVQDGNEADPAGWDAYADPVGAPTTTVRELVRADEQCVVARVLRDQSAVFAEGGGDPDPSWFVLRRRAEGDDPPSELNPTPWRIAFDGYTPDRDEPRAEWCA